MVAYQRDNESISQNLDCDRIIFQTLDDLHAACTEPLRLQNLDEPKVFEAGVFSGKYATPVSPGYFDHLQEVRGNRQLLKDFDIPPQPVA